VSEAAEQRWFAGLPVAGERRLTDEERVELNAFLRTIRTAAIKTYAYFAVPMLLIVFGDSIPIDFPIRTFAMFLLLILTFRGGARNAAMQVRWYRDARADRDNGVVDICRGPVADSIIAVATLRGREQLPVSSDQEMLEAEVLPRSALLWTYNRRRTVQPMFVPRARTSTPPDHARMAANFVKPVEGAENVFTHQRRLNDHELEELRAYIPTVAPIHVALALVMAIGGCIFIAAAVRSVDAIIGIGGVGLLLIGAARLIGFARRMRFRGKLRDDIRESYVVIVRESTDANGTLSAPVEFLPHTQWVWSRNGLPATWRRVSARQ
jgi:hypothetical protein